MVDIEVLHDEVWQVTKVCRIAEKSVDDGLVQSCRRPSQISPHASTLRLESASHLWSSSDGSLRETRVPISRRRISRKGISTSFRQVLARSVSTKYHYVE